MLLGNLLLIRLRGPDVGRGRIGRLPATTRNLRARDPSRAKQAVHTACILTRLRRASHAYRLPSHPHATAPSSDDAKLTSSRPFASQTDCPHRPHPHAPATLRSLSRPSTPPASSSARDSSRAPPAVHTAYYLHSQAPTTICEPNRLSTPPAPRALATLRALRRLSTPPASSSRRLYILLH